MRPRTAYEIDQALEEWKRRLAAIANNLMELQAQPAYKLLTGSSASISGQTAAVLRPALAEVPRIFEYFGLVHATVERASALRAAPALFHSEARLREAEFLLFGRSIRLADTDIPLDQRSLITAGRQTECVAAETLLGSMSKAFAAARDAVLRVERTWLDLTPPLTNAESRLAALTSQLGNAAQLTQAASLLAELTHRLQTDPFSIADDLRDRLEPMLARLEQQAHRTARLSVELAEAPRLLADLRAAERDSATAASDAQARILDANPAATTASAAAGTTTASLELWLSRLTAVSNSGNSSALEVGLRQWHAAIGNRLAEERQRAAAARALLDTRDELRGRLDALKAKARRCGVAETGPVAACAGQADQLLRARPTDLARAAAAVAAYEHLLRRAPEAPPK